MDVGARWRASGGSLYYSVLECVYRFHYKVLRSWESNRGANGTYVNDLFMEQPDHNLPSLCDLPVQIGDDSAREEKKERQTLLRGFCRLWITTGCEGTGVFVCKLLWSNCAPEQPCLVTWEVKCIIAMVLPTLHMEYLRDRKETHSPSSDQVIELLWAGGPTSVFLKWMWI